MLPPPATSAHSLYPRSLHPQVEAKNLETLEVKGLDSGDKANQRALQGEGAPLMYVVDNGEQIFRMPVHQLLRAIEARRQDVLDANQFESISGEYLLSVSVAANGQPAEPSTSEVIKVVNPFALGGGGGGKSGGGGMGAFTAERRVDWQRDWSTCSRSLAFREVEVDPGVHAILVPHVPMLQSIYCAIADRRDGWALEAKRKAAAETAAVEKAAAEKAPAQKAAAEEAASAEKAEEAAAAEGGSRTVAPAAAPSPAAATASGAPAAAPTAATRAPLLTLEDWRELGKLWKLTSSGEKGGGKPPLTQADFDDQIPEHFAHTSQLPASMRNQPSSATSVNSAGTWGSRSSFASRFSSSTVNLVSAGSDAEGSADISSASVDGTASMSFAIFLEALIMSARLKFGAKLPIAAAIEKLLMEHVKRNGVGYDGEPSDVIVDPLREELTRGEACRKMVNQLRPQLTELYRHWSEQDEEDERTDRLTPKELLAMLERASLLGKKLSVVTTRGLLMLTLFENRFGGYNQKQHDDLHLNFGDLVEVLARVAREYLKGSTVAVELADQLREVTLHLHKTVSNARQLQPLELKEPKKSSKAAAGGVASAAPAPPA